jgi:hypothetical protein
MFAMLQQLHWGSIRDESLRTVLCSREANDGEDERPSPFVTAREQLVWNASMLGNVAHGVFFLVLGADL